MVTPYEFEHLVSSLTPLEVRTQHHTDCTALTNILSSPE